MAHRKQLLSKVGVIQMMKDWTLAWLIMDGEAVLNRPGRIRQWLYRRILFHGIQGSTPVAIWIVTELLRRALDEE